MADPQIRDQILEVLANPMDLPSTFWDYATQSWLKDAPVFPISQVFGFTQFTASYANVVTLESTASTVYTDLATAGPTLSNLADGRYLILFGAGMATSSAGNSSFMSVQINAVAATDSDGIFTNTADNVSSSGAVIKSLSNNGSNTVTAKYHCQGAATGAFNRRFLVALRFGNL